MSLRPARLVAVVALAAVLSSCSSEASSGEAQEQVAQEGSCAAASDGVVQATQRYLAGFAEEPAEAPPSAAPGALTDLEWSDAVSDIQSFAASAGCDEEQFSDDVSAGLADVDAPSPLARTLLLQLRAGTPLGAPRTATVGPGDDLAAVAATLPPGSTLALEPGTYERTDPLVLLRGITVAGPSRDTTVISSSSPDGVVLALTGEATAFRGVELRRTSEEPGAVVLAGPVAQLSLEDVRITGARADAAGAGGTGVVVAPAAEQEQEQEQGGLQRMAAVRITRGELTGNASSGVVVSGGNRVEVRQTTVTGAGQCGICFLDTSDGLVESSVLSDNAVGVLSVGGSRPSITGTQVRGGQVSVQADEQAAPVLTGNELATPARAAIIVGGSVRGRLDGNRCVETQVGIVVNGDAVPFVGDNPGCQVVRGQ